MGTTETSYSIGSNDNYRGFARINGAYYIALFDSVNDDISIEKSSTLGGTYSGVGGTDFPGNPTSGRNVRSVGNFCFARDQNKIYVAWTNESVYDLWVSVFDCTTDTWTDEFQVGTYSGDSQTDPPNVAVRPGDGRVYIHSVDGTEKVMGTDYRRTTLFYTDDDGATALNTVGTALNAFGGQTGQEASCEPLGAKILHGSGRLAFARTDGTSPEPWGIVSATGNTASGGSSRGTIVDSFMNVKGEVVSGDFELFHVIASQDNALQTTDSYAAWSTYTGQFKNNISVDDAVKIGSYYAYIRDDATNGIEIAWAQEGSPPSSVDFSQDFAGSYSISTGVSIADIDSDGKLIYTVYGPSGDTLYIRSVQPPNAAVTVTGVEAGCYPGATQWPDDEQVGWLDVRNFIREATGESLTAINDGSLGTVTLALQENSFSRDKLHITDTGDIYFIAAIDSRGDLFDGNRKVGALALKSTDEGKSWSLLDGSNSPIYSATSATNDRGLQRHLAYYWENGSNKRIYNLFAWPGIESSGFFQRDCFYFDIVSETWSGNFFGTTPVDSAQDIYQGLFVTNEASPKVLYLRREGNGANDFGELYRNTGGVGAGFTATDISVSDPTNNQPAAYWHSSRTNNFYVLYQTSTSGTYAYSVYDASGGTWRSRDNSSTNWSNTATSFIDEANMVWEFNDGTNDYLLAIGQTSSGLATQESFVTITDVNSPSEPVDRSLITADTAENGFEVYKNIDGDYEVYTWSDDQIGKLKNTSTNIGLSVAVTTNDPLDVDTNTTTEDLITLVDGGVVEFGSGPIAFNETADLKAFIFNRNAGGTSSAHQFFVFSSALSAGFKVTGESATGSVGTVTVSTTQNAVGNGLTFVTSKNFYSDTNPVDIYPISGTTKTSETGPTRYVPVIYNSGDKAVGVFKTTTGTDYVEQDSANRFVITGGTYEPRGASSFYHINGASEFLYIVLYDDDVGGNATFRLRRFNLVTDSWDTGYTPADYTTTNGGLSRKPINMFVTNEASEKVVFTIMNDADDECYVVRYDGSSWSETNVHTNTTDAVGIVTAGGSTKTNNYYVAYAISTTQSYISIYNASAGSWRSQANATTIDFDYLSFNADLKAWNNYLHEGDDGTNDIMYGVVIPEGSSNADKVISFLDQNAFDDPTEQFDFSSDTDHSQPPERTCFKQLSTGQFAHFMINVPSDTLFQWVSPANDLTSWTKTVIANFSNPPYFPNGLDNISYSLGSSNNSYAFLSLSGELRNTGPTTTTPPHVWGLEFGDITNIASVSGVSVQGFVGTAVTNNESAEVTGVSATGQNGTVSVLSGIEVPVTGEEVTGTAGTATISSQQIITVTGEAATGSEGTATATAGVNQSVTGEQVTGSEGTVDAGVSVTQSVTGEQVTGSEGSVTVTGIANVSVTGEAGVSAVGTVTVSADQVTTVTGFLVTGSEGNVTVDTITTVDVTGEAGTSAVGTVTVTGDSIFNATGESVTGSEGTVTITEGTGHTENLVGEQVTGSVNSITFFTSTTLAPDSDVSAGLWQPSTGGTLFGVVDEASPNDTDYAFTEDPSNDTMRLGFPSVTDPEASHGHVVSYRYEKQSTGTINLTVTLYSGVTQIAQWTHNNISQTVVQADQTLSESEANAITDYTALEIEFTANLV